ncbi:MAG: hypothetical protein LBC93_08645 [Synergistaceae bacterium]|jgi:DNA polymerase-3 subunit delta|nr:hypothetical protein [Synergistaceae bacterium]
MPRLIVIEAHESQRRKLEELLAELTRKGYALTGRVESAPPGGWPEVIAASRSGGLFDAKRMMVVEGAEQLGPFPPALVNLLENEADDVIVAVFAGDTKNTQKIFSGVSSQKITFIRAEVAVPPWKRGKWLIGLAAERSCRLDASAAALLAESLESQEELRAELSKLAFHADGKPITVETVKLLSFDEGGNALLRFLDGVCQNRPKDVVNALRHLQSDPSPLPLLTALYNRLRPALYIACASLQTETKALAAIGATREYALRMARAALEHFGREGIKNFMLGLIRLSYLEKTSAAEGWPGFEVALWGLMGQVEHADG